MKIHWWLHRYSNTDQNSTMTTTSLHIQNSFIFAAKVSLPSFYLLIGALQSHFIFLYPHARARAYTFSQQLNIYSANMCFYSHAHIHIILTSYQEYFKTFELLNFWCFTTTTHKSTKNMSV